VPRYEFGPLVLERTGRTLMADGRAVAVPGKTRQILRAI
jgi:hypothetical protein